MKNTFHFAIIAFLLFGLTLGCGGDKIKTEYVEGVITYKGAPVDRAMVNFSPAAGGGSSAYGTTNASGVYKIQTSLGEADRGTTPGEYIVLVSKTEPIPTGKFETDSDGNRYEIMGEHRSLIPPIYNSSTTSPLRATVVKGNNKFDFDLVD